MNKMFYHWTEASVSQFYSKEDQGLGRFKSRVQGRAFTTTKLKSRFGTTKAINAKTVLVFAGAASELCKPYSLLKFDGYKRFLGQFYSSVRGDIIWRPEHAVAVGKVVLITKAEVVPIKDAQRKTARAWERFNRSLPYILLAALALLALASVGLYMGLEDFPFRSYLDENKSNILTYTCWILAVALATLIVANIPLLLSHRPNVDSDLEEAIARAKKLDLYR